VPPRNDDQVREIPFNRIVQLLREGRTVPVLGPGQPRPAIENAQEAESSFAAQELAELVAREAKFPIDEPEHARRDLWRVASYYGRRQREDLEDYLKEVFEKRATLGPLHRQLAANEPPLLLTTTNFDTLLEQAFNEIKRDYDLVISRGPKVEHRRVQYRALAPKISKISRNLKKNISISEYLLLLRNFNPPFSTSCPVGSTRIAYSALPRRIT
jgi:hypothetical protein